MSYFSLYLFKTKRKMKKNNEIRITKNEKLKY